MGNAAGLASPANKKLLQQHMLRPLTHTDHSIRSKGLCSEDVGDSQSVP